VRASFDLHVLAVKGLVAPDRRFGVGLGLSAAAARDLSRPDELGAFEEYLEEHGLYVFTMNGFPYGAFHGARVKEDVYRPDWTEDARLEYTDTLARLLARLLPAEDGLEGSISTVPGASSARVSGEAGTARITEMILRHAATLHRLHELTGKVITLALEPEPGCLLETVAQTVSFFERWLFDARAARRFGELTSLTPDASELFLRRHLGVCFDACHMAVEFEEPESAFRAFRESGIRILKVQLSAGLRVLFDGKSPQALGALRPFAEEVYLHQVVERRAGALTRYMDLPDALTAAGRRDGGDREWRIHFHVPIFEERFGPFLNTQDDLLRVCDIIRRDDPCSHLEVETYTWDVLPQEHRREGIVQSVAREILWADSRLTP